MYLYRNECIRTCTYTYIYICTHTHTHTEIHTYILRRSRGSGMACAQNQDTRSACLRQGGIHDEGIHANMHAHTHTHTQKVYMHVIIHILEEDSYYICMYACVHACMYTSINMFKQYIYTILLAEKYITYIYSCVRFMNQFNNRACVAFRPKSIDINI